jgi:hypothetical protein
VQVLIKRGYYIVPSPSTALFIPQKHTLFVGASHLLEQKAWGNFYITAKDTKNDGCLELARIFVMSEYW